MSAALSLYFGGRSVRVVLRDDEPLWVAADVAACLGYRDASNALRLLDEDEKGTHEVSTPGGMQRLLVVNESGLFHLILKSRLRGAVEFRRWVTGEVLPSIRRTGGYGTALLGDPDRLRTLLAPIVSDILHANFAILRTEIRSSQTWTLDEWCRRKRVTLTAKQARSIGGALAAICRVDGLPMGRQASEYRRGTPPRTYPLTVLERHFAPLLDRHAPSPQLALVASPALAPQVSA